MIGSIEKRVTAWPDMVPYYRDPAHAAPSRSTEAVLNALILAFYDTSADSPSVLGRLAFNSAWSLQETTGEDAGGWHWQGFHEAPWEAADSRYQGAAMMALAVGMMPEQYRNESQIRDHVRRLKEDMLRNYAVQPLLNQLYVLWASVQMPGLLSNAQRKDLAERIATLQNEDGGWSLSDLDGQASLKSALLDLFKHADNVYGSDGVATGLVVLALEKTTSNLRDPALQRGLVWLRTHQLQEGSWWASSLNGFPNPASDTGHFMCDAATGYAVLELEENRNQVVRSAPYDANTGP